MTIVVEKKDKEVVVVEKKITVNQNAGVDQIPADWEQGDETKPDFIKNKPVIPDAPAWGGISGNLADQQDLVTELEKRQMAGEAVSLNENQEINFNGKASIQYHELTDPMGGDDSSLNINAPKVVFSGEVNAPDSGRFATKVDKVAGKGLSTNDYTNEDKQQINTNTTAINNIYQEELPPLYSGKVDKVEGKGLSTNDFTDDDKQQIAVNKNSIWLIKNEDLPALDNAKVDKIPGKSLSTNDYTTAEKTKLNSAVTSSTIATIVTLTQATYDALNPKVATTLYIITGA